MYRPSVPDMSDPLPQAYWDDLPTLTGCFHDNYTSSPTPQHVTFQNEEDEKIPALKRHVAIPRTLGNTKDFCRTWFTGNVIEQQFLKTHFPPSKNRNPSGFIEVNPRWRLGENRSPFCLEPYKQNRPTQRIWQQWHLMFRGIVASIWPDSCLLFYSLSFRFWPSLNSDFGS